MRPRRARDDHRPLAGQAEAVVARAAALPGPGSLRTITADLSLMRGAREIGERLADELGHVDLLLNAVGILITRAAHTEHGQAQLANDLLTAQAADRYGVTAIGYGPGAVDTSIRREVPGLLRAIMKPFYARSTRRPEDVGRQIADIFADPALESGDTAFFDRDGRFPTASFIADDARQAALLLASLALSGKALASR